MIAVLAPWLAAAQSRPDVKRPRLDSGADTNDARAYYDRGVYLLERDPETAANAFFWATRLEPGWAEALYARRIAGLMANQNLLIGYMRGDRGMIGITISEATKSFKPGPLEAIKLSVERNIETSGLIFRTLGGLFSGETSPRQLMGPVAIAQLSGESAQAGWIALLMLMASISLNLGLLNLMPVPVLDGGHIIIMALEGIARRDFSMAVKEKMLLAGFVLLMMLMVTVIYNDLMRVQWIERIIPWR